jgi:hypothetical protein
MATSRTSANTTSRALTRRTCSEIRRPRLESIDGLAGRVGFAPDGRYLIVVFKRIARDWFRVITAYEVPKPGSRV